MKTWGKTISVVLGAILASTMAMSQMSCLSPEEKASIQSLNVALQTATGTIAKDREMIMVLQAELSKYKDEFKAIYAKIKAGEIPTEAGLALLGKVMANIESTQEKVTSTQKLIDENIASAKSVQASIADMKSKNVPWYMWLLPVGTAAAGIASMFVPGLSPLAQMLQTANQSLAATQEAAGSMSRTLDTVTKAGGVPTGQPIFVEQNGVTRQFYSLPEIKADLMHREQAGDELATKALYDELRAKAAAGLI